MPACLTPRLDMTNQAFGGSYLTHGVYTGLIRNLYCMRLEGLKAFQLFSMTLPWFTASRQCPAWEEHSRMVLANLADTNHIG